MEAQRTYIIVGLAIVTWLLYNAWQQDYAPQTTPQPVQNTQAIPDKLNDTPVVSTNLPTESDLLPQAPQAQQTPETSLQQNTLITVETDVLRLVINPVGGDVISAQLLNFPKEQNELNNPVELLKFTGGRTYTAMSGLIGTGMPDSTSPRAVYKSAEQTYALDDGATELVVPLTWTNEDGVAISKIFKLQRASYNIDVAYEFQNTTNKTMSGTWFGQLKRDRVVEESNKGGGIGIQAYLGAAYSTKEKRYERYDFDDMDESDLNVATKGGWIAFLQHYFLTAWVPDQETTNQIASLTPNNLAMIRVLTPTISVAPGETYQNSASLYLGPKVQSKLANIADGLDLTVDYGFLWWIGQPLFYLLKWFHGLLGNWGLAIIGVTFSVKLVLYPLSAAQYRSFAKMRHIQPKVNSLKDRYGEDRQKMSQAMMELYRKEKVNPLGGCLPLLVQMPVFIALYWVLLESVELRHADFYLWINDLSAMDPYYVLPLLMGASMFLMQKMQPTAATMDPMQQKIMQFMPVIMTVFFLFFPAGLVLYWLFNNLLSIAQQLYVTNKVEKQLAARPSNRTPK
ncbi:MAG: membrane protein insertase YidC [Gammaproteobacteria bacterium]|nr:membrane protein insertase YidC [Gammaproteobacteria bacterium]NNJ71645.1 membrane protein insertase YidC [Enterobacterales bacterium]